MGAAHFLPDGCYLYVIVTQFVAKPIMLPYFYASFPQQFLYFLPLPQMHVSLRPTSTALTFGFFSQVHPLLLDAQQLVLSLLLDVQGCC